MIERYTRKEIGNIWTEEHKFETWLKVEIAASEAMAHFGYIPKSVPVALKKRGKIRIERIQAIEQVVQHDVIAFLTSISEVVGPASKYVHFGMTSSDVLDTALALQIQEASNILIKQQKRLIKSLATLARRHRNTLMIGRSHGVHAEPITFGLKMALFYEEARRNLKRLEAATEDIGYGKISGAVGTFANIEPKVEVFICRKLGLKAEPVSNQVIQRDRHAQYMTTLAVLGSSLERLAVEIRHLQKTETLEAEESFGKGQKGSSAMPHKKNPIVCERVTGLARLLRSNAHAALENVALWHERDISHSSVERVIFPDSTIMLDYMLEKMVSVLDNLVVHKENMLRNLEQSRGRVYSQGLLLALVKKGLTREASYALVQQAALKSWQEDQDFEAIALSDAAIGKHLDKKAIRAVFRPEYHTRNIGKIFKRIGL